ncbi:JUPI2 protein, partial [Horornis vulcanius]|nr:JUPI2 protein [Horornis vulcanius]
RVLKPPGGDSSNLFVSTEEVSSSSRPHRMASNIFGASEQPQNVPKRTNPPGKSFPLFLCDGALNCSIEWFCVPKLEHWDPSFYDHIVLKEEEIPKKLEATENIKPHLEDGGEKKILGKEEQCKEPEPKIDNHEPRLGPRPRSHNKVLNPPGGKSSIAFY